MTQMINKYAFQIESTGQKQCAQTTMMPTTTMKMDNSGSGSTLPRAKKVLAYNIKNYSKHING